jgi:MFS family permease
VIGLFAITSILIGFGAGLVIPWFQVYFRLKFDASYSNIGYVFALQQFVLALSILLMPKIADRTGSVNTIVITQGLAIIVLVLIPSSPLFALAAVLFVVRAVLMNIAGPIQGAFMMGIICEEDRASATAINSLCWTGAWSLGTVVAGYVMEWNIDAPFIITAAFYTAYSVLFYLFFKDIKERRT